MSHTSQNQGISRAAFFLETRKEPISLPFPASRDCMHSLTWGPFPSSKYISSLFASVAISVLTLTPQPSSCKNTLGPPG